MSNISPSPDLNWVEILMECQLLLGLKLENYYILKEFDNSIKKRKSQ